MIINDLSQWLVDYGATYPEKPDQIAIWRGPIMACAPADDRFLRLKEITICPCSATSPVPVNS